MNIFAAVFNSNSSCFPSVISNSSPVSIESSIWFINLELSVQSKSTLELQKTFISCVLHSPLLRGYYKLKTFKCWVELWVEHETYEHQELYYTIWQVTLPGASIYRKITIQMNFWFGLLFIVEKLQWFQLTFSLINIINSSSTTTSEAFPNSKSL